MSLTDFDATHVGFVVVTLLIFATFAKKSVIFVREGQVVIIFRLARYQRTIVSGVAFLIPLIDVSRKVNIARDVPGWRTMSPQQRISAAQSLVLLGRVDPEFKISR